MELRERIAREVLPISRSAYADFAEADDDDRATALEIADAVIDALRLTREEEWVEPRPGSTTKFAPHTVERYVTPWGRPKPAWHDALAVVAHVDDFRGAQRRVFVRRTDDSGGICWGDEFSEWPSGELIDPVPLWERVDDA